MYNFPLRWRFNLLYAWGGVKREPRKKLSAPNQSSFKVSPWKIRIYPPEDGGVGEVKGTKWKKPKLFSCRLNWLHRTLHHQQKWASIHMETGKRKSKIEVRNVYISGRWPQAKLSFVPLSTGGRPFTVYCNGLIKGSPWVIKLLTTVSENRNFVP